ncbi:radical SAM protein [Campylobacter sp. JMF_15 NE4]|uniref:radical SAM protein n=1 Tax=Campylobacter sp. JMF_15 NE4 TaxID=2983825 RepID=UPI0022E9E376|nr:radical SAM protein [Campylobacter sp. JMF_15 NE4]MDA3049592.1 radical SAM protein [Campylobacter sp. JMF_15 NE4]
MKYIFGPVSSRRFGQSLGIDLSPNSKQCNFNCAYCELKAKKPISQMSEICDIPPVLDELKTALAKFKNTQVITLTANGEPSLHPKFGELVSEIKALKLSQKLLVLSNSSRICENYEAFLKCDICKFSLDSVVSETFKKIDNPHDSVNLDEIISNLIKFSSEFKGELVIEILVVAGLNDNVSEFEALNSVLEKINPARIDLGTIDRPPAFKNAKPVSYERLEFLSKFLKNQSVNIVAKPKYDSEKLDFSEDEILSMLVRRPQSLSDVKAKFSELSKANLTNLLNLGKITLKDGFYKVL